MKASELLGPLEGEVMEVMWRIKEGTVRQVVTSIQAHRKVAYTTVMTIMNNLVAKGLLKRIPQGKAYLYSVTMTRKAFLEKKSQEAVSDVLARFGDLAIARFVEAVAQLRPEELQRLRQLAQGEGTPEMQEEM
jgi:predicted transcriptional regulator